MKIHSIRIRNYRSIAEDQTIQITPGLTLVGPNNSGKTNVLGALRMFFTGYPNNYGYSRERDLTFGKSREQTTLVATLETDPDRDSDHLDRYDRLLELYDPPRKRDGRYITLQLLFSSTGNPTYRLSSDTTSRLPRDQQANHSRLLHELVDGIIDNTAVHYVPSSNSSEQLFADLVTPLIKKTVATQLKDEIQAINTSLRSISTDLTTTVRDADVTELEINLSLRGLDDGEFLSPFDFSLSDPVPTAAVDKGRGIQALAMLACFEWIAQKEYSSRINSIWLIEEPESFLHPSLYPKAQRLIDQIEQHGQVVRTTHALTMVPRDSTTIVGTRSDSNGKSILSTYPSLEDATAELRGSLGVKFSDFFALAQYNVFTEGESDLEMLDWALDGPFQNVDFPLLRKSHRREFGGVSNLAGFLKANYSFIRPETAVVSLFDGDPAGVKAIREVGGFLTNAGSGFAPNIDYVVGRKDHAIEGLFGDELLSSMHHAHPNWFEIWHTDAGGAVFDYKIKDQSKASVGRWLREAATEDTRASWEPHWNNTLRALEDALSKWREGRR